MRFSTRERFDALPDRVFEVLTDFDRFEAMFRPYLARLDRVAQDPVWEAEAEVRGMSRRFVTRVAEFSAPAGFTMQTVSGEVTALFRVALEGQGGAGTEARIGLDLSARSLPGKLFLKSLKLTKPALDQRFKARVAGFAERIRPEIERA